MELWFFFIFLLPAWPILWLLHGALKLYEGNDHHCGSGEIGLAMLIGTPISIIGWIVILYEIIKHVRISIV